MHHQWVPAGAEPAAAAIAAASRERIEEEEAESLQALESHVSKLDEALHEKELAMEKMIKDLEVSWKTLEFDHETHKVNIW